MVFLISFSVLNTYLMSFQNYLYIQKDESNFFYLERKTKLFLTVCCVVDIFLCPCCLYLPSTVYFGNCYWQTFRLFLAFKYLANTEWTYLFLVICSVYCQDSYLEVKPLFQQDWSLTVTSNTKLSYVCTDTLTIKVVVSVFVQQLYQHQYLPLLLLPVQNDHLFNLHLVNLNIFF